MENYIRSHRASISFTYKVNDKVCISVNSNKKLPIASTAKFTVVIELAR